MTTPGRFVFAALLLLTLSSCVRSPGEESSSLSSAVSAEDRPSLLTGKYAITQWTCGSVDITSAVSVVTTRPTIHVNGRAATVSLPILNGCSANWNVGLRYPASEQIALSLGATTCSPSCLGIECSPSSASAQSTSFEISQDKEEITLSHTVSAADLGNAQNLFSRVGCKVGDPLIMTLASE